MFDFTDSVVDQTTTALYRVLELEGQPILRVKCALEYNKPYFKGLVESSEGMQRRLNKSKKRNGGKPSVGASVKILEDNRVHDKELYGPHIVDGWETKDGPLDTDGKRAPYSPENADDFIRALPPHVFDNMRKFCGDIENFGGEIEDSEEVGNS